MNEHEHSTSTGSTRRHYAMFAVNMALSLAVMYFVMFIMIDARSDFRNNINTLYMALAMVAPMGIVMLATMKGMYASKPLNLAIYAGLSVRHAHAVPRRRSAVHRLHDSPPFRCNPHVPRGEHQGSGAGEAL
jgi:hypothetical protein